MFCRNCGQQIGDNSVICPFCGVATNQMNGIPMPERYGMEPKKTNGLGIAGFAVGLIGMFGGNFLYLMPGIVALILSIIGVVQIKKCNSCNGLAIAGLVISIISFIMWFALWAYTFVGIINGDIPIEFMKF